MKQFKWRRRGSEWWIGTITIEMAKIKYLKTVWAFFSNAALSAINL
jgi:hypothetical protein